MKKVSVVCSLSLLAGSHLFPQKEYSIKVMDTVRDYCSFNKVQVIDDRVNRPDVGYIKTGAFNSKSELIPAAGMENMMGQITK